MPSQENTNPNSSIRDNANLIELIEQQKQQAGKEIADAGREVVESEIQAQREKAKAEREKRERAKTKRKGLLLKLLDGKLDQTKVQAELSKIKDRGSEQKPVDDILTALSKIKNNDLSPDLYRELLKQLRSEDYRGVAKLVESAKNKQTIARREENDNQATTETKDLLNKIIFEPNNLAEALSKQPLYLLEQNLAGANNKLSLLRRELNNKNLSDTERQEIELAITSKEYEFKKLAEAVIKRDLANYELVSDTLHSNPNGQVGGILAEIKDKITSQELSDEARTELRELSDILNGLNSFAIFQADNSSSQTGEGDSQPTPSRREVRQQLERARSLIEKHFDFNDRIQTSETVKKLSKQRQQAEKYERARDITTILPPGEVQKARRKIEREDYTPQDLSQYLALVKTKYEGKWDQVLGVEDIQGGHKLGAYRARIRELISKPVTNLSELEQYELASLLGTLTTKLDSIDLQERLTKAKNDQTTVSRLFSDLAKEHKQRLLGLVTTKEARTLSSQTDQELSQQLGSPETIDLISNKLGEFLNLEADLTAPENESLHNFAEYLASASDIFALDFESQLQFNSDRVKVHATRQELTERIIKEGGLSLDAIRETFNFYELPGLNIHEEQGLLALKEELKQQGFDPEAAEVKEAIKIAREQGPLALELYCSEPDRQSLGEAITIGLIRPYEHIKADANQQEKLVPKGAANELLEQMLEYYRRQKQLTPLWERLTAERKQGGEGELSKNLSRYAFKTIIFNNLLNRLNQRGGANKEASDGLKEQFEQLAATDDRELIAQLRNLITKAGLQEPAEPLLKQLSEIEAVLNGEEVTSLNDFISLEAAPGGMIVTFKDEKLMQWLTGLESPVFSGIKGITLKQANLLELKLDLGQGEQVYQAALALVNGESAYHEQLHLLENILSEAVIGQAELAESEYHRYGLDEIVANLIGPNYEATMAEMKGLSFMNLQLDAAVLKRIKNLPPDQQKAAYKQEIAKDQNLLKAYTILELSREITAKAAESMDDEFKTVTNEMLRHILSQTGDDLDEIIYNLYRNFSELELAGMDIGKRQDILSKLAQATDQSTETAGSELRHSQLKGSLGRNLFHYYQQPEAERKPLLASVNETIRPEEIKYDPFSSLAWDEFNNWPYYLNKQLELANSKQTFIFFNGNGNSAERMQDYQGLIAESPRSPNARVPDPLNVKDVFANYGYKRHKGELKAKITMGDAFRRREIPSYFEEKYPLRWVHLPGSKKIAPIRMLEDWVLNGAINYTARSMFGLNTRDFSSAWAGTAVGRWLEVSPFRSTSPAGRFGYLNPMARAGQEWFAEKYKGINERDKYVGHVYPDYLRLSPINDRHYSMLAVNQEALSRYIGGGQTYALMEKLKFTTLNAAPNDRPSSNPEINDQKAGTIDEFTLQRAYAQAFNFDSSMEDQAGYSDYQTPFELSVGPWKDNSVVLDKNGNLRIAFRPEFLAQEANQYLLAHLDENNTLPLDEDVVRELMPGANKILAKDGTFFSGWRQPRVRYNNQLYYVHYDPRTGLPGLYKKKYIDWTRPPQPITENGQIVQPREGTYQNLPATDSPIHRMSMNAATTGLYQTMMQARERQKAFNQQHPDHAINVYSFKDLIRSTRSYEDPDSPADGFYVKVVDKSRGFKEIRIPIPTGVDNEGNVTYEYQVVDFNVANELINRMEKFDLRDNIKRQAYVKGQPEHVQREGDMAINHKHRETIRMYLEMITDPELRFFGTEISNDDPPPGTDPGNLVKRILFEDIRDINQLVDPYFQTPEGAAVRLRYLKSVIPIAEQKTNADLLAAQSLVEKYAYLNEYESLLYDGMHSLFVDRPAAEKKQVRDQIKNYVNQVIGDANDANSLFSRVKASMLAANPNLSDQEVMDAIRAGIVHDERGNVDPYNRQQGAQLTLFGQLINRIYNTPVDNSSADNSVVIVNGQSFEVAPALQNNPALEADMNQTLDSLKNINFDKRPIERFMGDKSKQEVYELSNELMGLVQDRDKYRQEMRNYMLSVMELAEFKLQEFNRYRRAKYFWESAAKLLRRINTPIFMGATLALFMTTSPLILPIILANIGVAKTAIPFMDKWTAIAVNRRNYARELARKMRSEANHIIEMYEKGMTLTHSMRTDIDDMILEYNILGESIQGKKLPEGWSPGANMGIDALVNALVGEEGMYAKAMSA